MPTPPFVLTTAGNTDLAHLAKALRAAPRALGIGRFAEVRTVRLVGSDRQFNWGTILTAGREIDPAAPERISLADGSLLLLRRVVRLSELRTISKMTSFLSAWPGLPPEGLGAWQASVHVSRFSGEPGWQHPYWSLDLHRPGAPSHSPIETPPEPYFSAEANFFADQLPVAAAKWLLDPGGSSRWELRGTTRVVLFDPRAHFTTVDAETHRLRIEATSRRNEALVCWAQVVDFSGRSTDHRIDLVHGRGTLEVAEAIQRFDLFLFTAAGEFRDRYLHRGVRVGPAGHARPATQRFTASQKALLEDASSGETRYVELKEWIPPTGEETKYRELLKSVCAFANADGGRLYIGVKNEGEICGIDHPLKRAYEKDARGDVSRAREMYVRKLRDNIREGIEPAFDAEFAWVEHAGRSVLCVTVPRGAEQPYQTIDNRQYFIRKHGRSVLALPHEVEAMYLARTPRGRFR